MLIISQTIYKLTFKMQENNAMKGVREMRKRHLQKIHFIHDNS